MEGIFYRITRGGDGKVNSRRWNKKEKRRGGQRVIKEMKGGKAAGEDGIVNDILKEDDGKKQRREVWEICNRVWKGEGQQEEWEVGVIVPITKKEDGRTVEYYRGVALLNTMQNIYTMILVERLEREVEEKKIVPGNQTEFIKEERWTRYTGCSCYY